MIPFSLFNLNFYSLVLFVSSPTDCFNFLFIQAPVILILFFSFSRPFFPSCTNVLQSFSLFAPIIDFLSLLAALVFFLHPSIFPSFYRSIFFSFCLSIFLTFCLSIFLSIYLCNYSYPSYIHLLIYIFQMFKSVYLFPFSTIYLSYFFLI